MDRNTRIAKNTITLYVRMVFMMIVNLIAVRVLLKELGSSDYGLYNAIGGIVLSFAFISSVLSSASQRFFSYELGKKNYVGVQKLFSTMLLAYIGLSAVIVLFSETVGEWFLLHKMSYPIEQSNAVQFVFQFSIVSFVFTILCTPYQALIISYEDMSIYAWISVVDGLLKLLTAYSLNYFTQNKVTIYALLWAIVTIITCSMYVVFCKIRYKDIRFVLGFDKCNFKNVFLYSFWTLFGSTAATFNTQGLNILLNIFFGTLANAAFAISRQIYGAFLTLSSCFFTAIRPQITKSYASGDNERMKKLYYIGTKATYILLLVIIVPFIVDIHWILETWLGKIDLYVESFTVLMVVYTFVLCLSNPITTIAHANGNVKLYHGIIDSFTLICLPISYFFFKTGSHADMGYIVSIIVFFIAHFLRLVVLKKIVGFPIKEYLWKAMFPMFILIIIGYGVARICKCLLNPNTVVLHITQFILLATTMLLISILLCLSSYEKQILINMVFKRKNNNF